MSMTPKENSKRVYYRKQIPLFRLIDKMKRWPSRKGILHGIISFDVKGSYATLITHCNREMVVRNSKHSRAARWLRNKWFLRACEDCRIPEWKIEKYSTTVFKRGWGSFLVNRDESRKSIGS